MEPIDNIKNAVSDQTEPPQQSSQEQPTIKTSLSRIREVFSDDEISELLDSAYRKRISSIKQQEYFEKLGAIDYSPPAMTTDQYRDIFEENYHLENKRKFEYTAENEKVVHALCLYFAQDEGFLELNSSYAFEKGISLVGNVGVGKTSILKAFRANPIKSFGVIDCKEVVKSYAEKKQDRFQLYTNPNHNISQIQNYGQQSFGWLYDDLGEENEGSYFGNKLNVMADLIEKIYKREDMIGRCHITTNLNGDQIKEMYGERVRSRMRSIFNPIQFPATAKDMRR